MENDNFQTSTFYDAAYLMYIGSVKCDSIKLLLVDRSNDKRVFYFSDKANCEKYLIEKEKVDYAVYAGFIKELKRKIYD